MRLPFSEAKATQAAARFLRLRGAPMSYMKLLKLLYMADRTALLRWGAPITMDRWVSMKHGPVLSNVYSLIVDEQMPLAPTIWSRYISPPENYEVHLLHDDVPSDQLSLAEERLIDEMHNSFGHYEPWALVDHLHKLLPEWKNPGDTSTPIGLADILRTEGTDDTAVQEIEDELYALSHASNQLRSR